MTGNPLSRGEFTALEKWVATTLDAQQVEIARAERLSGGAVQQNWRIDALVDGGEHDGAQRWVLRTDAEASLIVSLDRTAEFGVVSAAHAGGVKVAAPIARCEDRDVIGSQFVLQAYVIGEAQGHRLTRDPAVDDWGPTVARELGQELAKIHRIRPENSDLGFLPQPMISPARSEVARLRAALDSAAEPRPALEYALTWLYDNDPGSEDLTLVHGDFRTGNYLVAEGHLSAVLDWEFAHWGDPHEDIGWLTAKCWRFGGKDKPTGGIASLAPFLEGYRSGAQTAIDESQLLYWQIMAAAKWATVAVLQGDRYRTGGENSLELALTGLMVTEIELECIDGIKLREVELANH
jgi:aminoglycoside phosphotransferase (APT) family kinase protein